MQLTKIVLYGFKSFADKTDFDFGQGVTIVVGPNGCGKSNIVEPFDGCSVSRALKACGAGRCST